MSIFLDSHKSMQMSDKWLPNRDWRRGTIYIYCIYIYTHIYTHIHVFNPKIVGVSSKITFVLRTKLISLTISMVKWHYHRVKSQIFPNSTR